MLASGLPAAALGNACGARDFQISAVAFGVSYMVEYTFVL
jgi:hypothetical protein